jgi:uncharacterized protein
VTDPRLAPPIPLADPDSEGFWSALSDGRLEICRCVECRTWLQPPLERCRRCGAETAFEPASGRGTVFSYIVVRHPAIPGFVPPYVVAMVEFDEQPGLRLTGVLGMEPADVSIGLAVAAEIREIGTSGINAVFFEPIDQR